MIYEMKIEFNFLFFNLCLLIILRFLICDLFWEKGLFAIYCNSFMEERVIIGSVYNRSKSLLQQ